MDQNNQLIFQCPGKLLITGEYAVLVGAVSLVVPVQYTQQLAILPGEDNQLHWITSYNETTYLSATFRLSDFQVLSCSDSQQAAFLTKLLQNVRRLNPMFLNYGGFRAHSVMGAHPQWGFGSSAQLTVNVARWAGVDPLELNHLVSNGSGADVACSMVGHAIHYSTSLKQPDFRKVSFNPPFADKLLLVYSNRKQDSSSSVKNFLLHRHLMDSVVNHFSEITREVTTTTNIRTFAGLLAEHEKMLKTVLKQPTVQETLFDGFPGVIKSLGAWGGDFMLAVPDIDVEDATEWFVGRGYSTVLSFHETMLLHDPE
ncbi:MAG TPA: hypothetical protein DCR43_06380 [Bacteroidales bacterium]|nr:MAG: hypothetical protein A2X11_07795 [Bacteroidetes bacterium GWE2_42_24]OFY26461.1 MAG: hypothetical protein A2X09_02160 [Bacteroidetes bacterium GWF2_43_11]HAQ65460.1 hypothetical protein [Bacteroidales bacterium]HBZ68137.1 hypothetical protein [Bacteroidales bacterium]